MNWQKLIAYILGGLALIVLGWVLHSSFVPKPTTEIKESVRYDTVYSTKQVRVVETKVIEKPIYRDSARTYADSIKGEKNEVAYNISHSISDNKEVVSSWQVNLEPKLKTVIQYVTKDSVRTIVEAKYVSLPFFLNPYFWSSIVLVVITALAIIF